MIPSRMRLLLGICIGLTIFAGCGSSIEYREFDDPTMVASALLPVELAEVCDSKVAEQFYSQRDFPTYLYSFGTLSKSPSIRLDSVIDWERVEGKEEKLAWFKSGWAFEIDRIRPKALVEHEKLVGEYFQKHLFSDDVLIFTKNFSSSPITFSEEGSRELVVGDATLVIDRVSFVLIVRCP